MADIRRSAPSLSPTARVALFCALGGALVLGWLAFGVVPGSGPEQFGSRIYDEAWLALRAGEVDLPARLLRYEGHYAPDGTAYLYHGAGPLLLRALLAPLVDLTRVSLAPASLWAWTALGCAFYHAAFHGAAARAGWLTPRSALVLGLGAWLAGPALLLVANHALYQEPIAMAYWLAAAAVWLWHRHFGLGRGAGWACLLGLALLAGLCLQARPNVAAALYAATGLAALRMLWRQRLRALLPAALALAVLAGGVAGYMGYNDLRFGSGAVTHGSFEPSALQYGAIYWGHEDLAGNRARTFIDHGRFDPARILPNGVQYLLGVPQALMPAASWRAQAVFYGLTHDKLGYIRIEWPDTGMLFMWLGWVALALGGMRRGRPARQRDGGANPGRETRASGGPGLERSGGLNAGPDNWGLGMLALAFGLSVLLTLSYATITLRYHVDLWPLLAVAVLGGLRVCPGRGVVLAGALGLSVLVVTAREYSDNFRAADEGFTAPWDRAFCEEMVQRRQIPATQGPEGAARLGRICRDPRTG
ncbi:hypothetical protein [Oceanicola sp. S124]|uniref:hypothetical protein n=1 Tax=Oceanicola sp. S124 TaxID=1042378 RepID=UPI000255852A|nr:hypothetical protein [Oceanicola sp. S124]